MGGAVSSGRDNNELIDNLMGGGYIRSRNVERVFRVLDRADYMVPTERDQAYKDLAWRSGALHLSAPCIYSEVMEALELKPGLSFLNLGSGTGYLSTLVGLIIGSRGISHGVEIHPGVVEYSNKKLSQFQENSVTLDEFDFCTPKYYCGNALCMAPLQTQYDRIYVGAGVMPKYEDYFKQMIKVKGLLVMPLGDTLVQIKRESDTEWTLRPLLNVSFALMRDPTKEESSNPLKLENLVPVSLMLLCRATIRAAMLGGVCRRHPELKEPAPRRPPSVRHRPRRICIPMEQDSDGDTDSDSMNDLHDMDRHDGGREMNALLSLVLSMGNNRGAGSLRFDEDHITNDDELEVLIDEMESGSSSDGSYRAGRRERPSAAGAANAAVVAGRPQRVAAVPDARTASTHARLPAQPAPGATPGGTDLSALTPAGRVECGGELEECRPTMVTDDKKAEADDSKPSTSGTIPAPAGDSARPASGSGTSSGSGGSGPSAGGKRSGGEGNGRRRARPPAPYGPHRRPHRRSKRYPPEVQIYFGNAGVYAGSDVVQQDVDEAANASAREDDHQDQYSSSQEDEELPHSSKDTKRQKLDSGIGEGTASGSTSSMSPTSAPHGSSHAQSQTLSPDDSDAANSTTHVDLGITDSQEVLNERARIRRRYSLLRRGGYDSESDTASQQAARRARRSARDARRVRLSITMKRAVKELPLPYALKKYVNLHRCFEF